MDVRSRDVMRAAVETYISSGEPVPSRAIGRDRVPLSPASVRAVMARLESEGLLVQPHTSAGRVPTDRGYRVYVDQLLPPHRVPEEQQAMLRDAVPRDAVDSRELMRACARVVSQITGLAGFAVGLTRADEPLRRVDFVRLGRREVLGIFTTQAGAVYHRRARLEIDVSSGELARFARYLNERLVGLTLDEIRTLVAYERDQMRRHVASLRGRAMALSEKLLPIQEDAPVELVVDGQHRLLEFPELANASAVGPVLEELERRETWTELLTATIAATDHPLVRIGPENGADGLRDCTIIATRIRWADGVDGTFGLLGPTRLAYSTAIAVSQMLRRQVMMSRARRRNSG